MRVEREGRKGWVAQVTPACRLWRATPEQALRERSDLPARRIHIDVQSLPAHNARPAIPRNPYRVDMGTAGLVLSVSSLEEILVDKILALALREPRVKWRDVCDIVWLDHQGVPVRPEFTREMRRFLPPGNLLDAVGEARYWEYVLHLIPTLV